MNLRIDNKGRLILVELEILKIIGSHIGKDHAIPRAALLDTLIARGYPVSDRRMRDAINHLRMTTGDGAWICSTQQGEGYFKAENVEELGAHLESERRRGKTILAKVSMQEKRAMPDLAGQVDIQGGA